MKRNVVFIVWCSLAILFAGGSYSSFNVGENLSGWLFALATACECVAALANRLQT